MSHPQELLERLQKRVGGRGVSQILYWSKLHPFDATSFFCSEPSFGNLCPKVQLHILLSLIKWLTKYDFAILLFETRTRLRLRSYLKGNRQSPDFKHQTIPQKNYENFNLCSLSGNLECQRATN